MTARHKGCTAIRAMPNRPSRALSSASFDARRRKLLAAALAALGAPQLPVFAAGKVDDRPGDGGPADAEDPATAPPVRGVWTHAYAAFGKPKYPAGFSQFDYAEPTAPKGGTLYLSNPDRRTSFDKFNYFTLRGNAPAGVIIWMLEQLAVRGSDEPMTMYGLIAEQMFIAPDNSQITFRLNPKARFYNGDPVRAADVKYSFDQQAGPHASPDWASNFAGVGAVTLLDDHTIRFEIKDRTTDSIIKLATFLRVFSPKWGAGPDGKPKPFDEIVSEYPITTGPYVIASTDSGRRIEFRRNPDYWGKDLPAQRGLYNFDRVVYRYFQDRQVGTEAFKAGEFDITRVYGARTWARQYKGAKWADGQIVNELFKDNQGQGLQSFQINLRRPIFADIRVREAIGLAWDFETINRYHTFQRAESVFNNSEFAAAGLPSRGELALLEPFRSVVPAAVFGPPYRAPETGGDPNALRANLLKARDLLGAAGWKLAADNRLRNAAGVAFEFEYLIPNDGGDAMWKHNLARLGIVLKERTVDYALYQRRLTAFDFDVATIVEPSFTLPSAQDYVGLYGSKAADEKGGSNYRGVKNPAIDRLLVAMGNATTLLELRDACRAFDRIVMWSHWQVPQLYADTLPTAYWNKFGMPVKRPNYMTVDLVFDLSQNIAWPLAAWWIKDPAKR